MHLAKTHGVDFQYPIKDRSTSPAVFQTEVWGFFKALFRTDYEQWSLDLNSLYSETLLMRPLLGRKIVLVITRLRY